MYFWNPTKSPWEKEYARPLKKGRLFPSLDCSNKESRVMEAFDKCVAVDQRDYLRRSLEKMLLENSVYLSRDLIEAIYERRLNSVDEFLRHSFTDVARLACHIPYLRKQMDSLFCMRPVPLREFETDTITFRSPSYYDAKCEFHVDAVFVSSGDYIKLGAPLFKLDVLHKTGEKMGSSKSYILMKLEKIHVGIGVRDNKYDKNMLYRVDDVLCEVGCVVVTGAPLCRIDSKRRIVLHRHQVNVVKFAHNLEANARDDPSKMNGGIIRLDPGLGKTLSTIFYSLCAQRPRYHNVEMGQFGFPTLIVCSKSLLSEWLSSGFEKFFHVSFEPRSDALFGKEDNRVRVLRLHKDFMSEDEMSMLHRGDIIRYDFVVTTYDVLQQALKRGGYKDECVEYEDINSETPKIARVRQRERHESDDASVTGVPLLFRTPWERVIVDESTKLSNPSTKIFVVMMSLYGRYKFCLAAEPIVNNVVDLWSQLRFCGLSQPDNKRDWEREYEDIMRDADGVKQNILSIGLAETDIKLPNLTHHEHRVHLDELGQAAYDHVRTLTKEALKDMKTGFKNVLTCTTRLRQLCIAAHLCVSLASENEKKIKKLKKQQKEDDENNPMEMDVDEDDAEMTKMLEGFDVNLVGFYNNPEIKTWINDEMGTAGLESPKLKEVSRLIGEFDAKDKVLIFSSFLSALKLLKRRLDGEDICCAIIDGKMTVQERQRVLSQFQSDPSLRVLMMTTKVGAFGYNITAASEVIFLDRWWNQTTQIQAMHRVYRPGQTKDVNIHYIITTKERKNEDDDIATIEDRIIELCLTKHQLSKDVFGSVSIDPSITSEGKTKQLIQML